MEQNGENNYYNNDYSRASNQQSPYYQQPAAPPPYPSGQQNNGSGGRSGVFWLGMLIGIITTALVGGCTFVGVKLYDVVQTRQAKQASADSSHAQSVVNDETLEKLEAIEEVIDKYYYIDEDIDADEMIEGMYAGMVDSLGDPYSVYYTAEEWADLLEETEGIYYGIGAYLSLDPATGLARISGVIADTPAQETGLRENDIIYLVDDESVAGLELSEIVSRVKGEENTVVHPTIVREGETDYLR